MNEQNKDQNSDSEPQIVSEEPEEILEDLNNDIEEIEKVSSEDIIKDLEDQILRSKAEVQNVRRIAAQEVTKARLFGIESLAREFLAVGDNLERAILSCQDNEDSDVIEEGLELTLKNLETSLKSSGIEVIDCENQIFDPVKHEAISVLENNDLETNTIIDVVQKGYTIMDRTLRPAKVVVSKKSWSFSQVCKPIYI